MVSTAGQLEKLKQDEALIRGQREAATISFCRYIWIFAGPAGLIEIAAWLFDHSLVPMLILSGFSLVTAALAFFYPEFRKRGQSTLGAGLAIISLALLCVYCLFFPQAELGAAIGFVIVVLIAHQAFGQRTGNWFIAISVALLMGGIIIMNSPIAPAKIQFDPTVNLFVTLFITGVLFLGISTLISTQTRRQEDYYIQSEHSAAEVDQRITSEQEQRARLQQANLEIERNAEIDRQQRKLLMEILNQVREATNDLNSAAAEIMAATTQQASGASEQSAAIAQTSTTVDEVKVIAEQSALRAQEMDGASQHALDVSRSGQNAVQETIASMNMIKERVEGIAENVLSLSEQTQQIGEIISTVSEIASQSNMLALNASVEAARAGEHGKGFAVVASEVRSLAEQSKVATVQIKSIIADIQKATNATVMATEEGNKGVDLGIQRVLQARSSIESLGSAVNENAQIAKQLYTGGRQQQTGIEQIAMAMQNIHQATIQNLTSTRQAEKAAQSLSELAKKLAVFVEKY